MPYLTTKGDKMKSSFFILLVFLVNMSLSAVPVNEEKGDLKISTIEKSAYYAACNCGCKGKKHGKA